VDARRVSAKHDRSFQLAAHTPVNAELRRQPGCHRGTRSRSPSCAGRLAPNSEYILPPRQPGPEGNAYREERYKQYASDYSLSIESLEMRADVVRYNQERRPAEDYGRIHQHIQRNGVAEARVQSWLGFAKSMVVLGLQAWLVFHWITLLSAHRLDGAMLVYLYMLSDQLCGSFSGYAGLFGRIGEAWQPIQSFLKISSATSALAVKEESPAAQVPACVSVEFRDVEFGYRPDEPVLDRLSLFVEGARKVGFVGRTGCGKSTLLKLVERLYDTQSGSVFVAGKDVRQWPLRQLQRICTCLSQNGGVFFSEATLLDTIRFAKPAASFLEVIQAAKLACIHDDHGSAGWLPEPRRGARQKSVWGPAPARGYRPGLAESSRSGEESRAAR
jgi:ABC-type multidrug transport system fused ATPase/permease subunit